MSTNNGTPEKRTGGCLCGAIRYEIPYALVGYVDHCHCSMCRKQSAAVAVTWTATKREDFKLTRGELTFYHSSPGCRRGFCNKCGTPIAFYTDATPEEVGLTMCSLDDEFIEPAVIHSEYGSGLRQFVLDPHLPTQETAD